MTEFRTGRVSIFKDGTMFVGDSMLQSFLAPYEGKEGTIEVRELD